MIDQIARAISFLLPAETDVTQLVPTIEVSEGATVEPASGVAQDFSNPVTYTVTAQNGTTAVYTVTVDLEGGNMEPTGKTVLIKDFTGARCVNCPAAAEHAHNLQHQLDEDHIFIMSVHAGYLAQPLGSFPDFLTDEGTEWYNNNNSNPLFTVDHVALTEGNTLNETQIDAPVTAALEEEQTFEIVVGPNYDETNRQLKVDVQAIALDDLDGHFFITVCLANSKSISLLNMVAWAIMEIAIPSKSLTLSFTCSATKSITSSGNSQPSRCTLLRKISLRNSSDGFSNSATMPHLKRVTSRSSRP